MTKANRLGPVAATLLSIGARGLGYAIYGMLRFVYRPRERMMVLVGLAGLVALAVLLAWLF